MYKYRRSSSTMIYYKVYSGTEIYVYKNNMAQCVTTGATRGYNKKSLTNAKRYNSAPLFGYQIYQCFGSRIQIGSGFNQVSGSVSGSRSAQMTHKNRKKIRNFVF
jgi:hypothetical protein